MNIPNDVLQATRERFAEREPIRVENAMKVAAGDIQGANNARQYELRMNRIERARAIVDDEAPAATNVALDMALERVIGQSDFINVAYLELGVKRAATVGRIHIGARDGRADGFGTGFLVSPRLLLTNNHVLSTRSQGADSLVEFNYQQGTDGRLARATMFELDPDTFFVTDADLDYTLVAVRDRSRDGRSTLRSFGWNRMIEQVGKVVIGEAVNIIQHPDAQPKKVALRENKVVDLLEDFIHYHTDTAPGSSGAPVYNDQWELIGLHHSGVPATDGDGNILTRDGMIWSPTMGEDAIRWLGNEGVRISRIIRNARGRNLTTAQRRLLEEALNARSRETDMGTDLPNDGHADDTSAVDDIDTIDADTALTTQPAHTFTLDGGTATWRIPVEISVRIGENGEATAFIGEQDLERRRARRPEEPRPTGYRNRDGYNTNFLGSGSFRVPLPKLTESIARSAAPLIDNPRSNELKYSHFSVVMNKERRLAFYTAVNIDGKQSRNLNRSGDNWIYDPRIRREYQIGNEAYERNRLDRGHLVRRLDPVWGTGTVAQLANEDTFHFTNCTPQHEAFNQRTWLELEDHILENTDVHDLKVSVFTGPVFRADDRTYRSIRLPQQYWKVVVMVRQDTGRLSATGYMLSQKDLLNRLEAAFVFGPFKTYQVPIRLIEELTGIDFGDLKSSDPLNRRVGQRETLLESTLRRGEVVELDDLNDLVL